MLNLRTLILLLFAATCFQGFALDSKPVVLNPTTGNFRNIPNGDRLTLPDATGDLVTIDVGVQAAPRTVQLPTLAGTDTIATLAVANVFTAIQSIQMAPASVAHGLAVLSPTLTANQKSSLIIGRTQANNEAFYAAFNYNTTEANRYLAFQDYANAVGSKSLVLYSDGGADIGNASAGTSPGAGLLRLAITSGSHMILSTNDATTKDTGSIVTEGGIGAEKAIVAGTTMYATTGFTLASGNFLLGNTGQTIYATTGDVYMRAGTGGQLRLGAGGSNDYLNISSAGVVTTSNTTASTTTGTGAVVLSGSGAGLGVNGQVTAARLTAIETTSNKNMHNVNSSALAAGAGKSSTLWLDFVSSGFGAGDRAAGMSAVIEADNTNLLIEYNYFNGSTYNTWSRFTGSTGVYALTGTTDSTSTTTGALIGSGGAGFAKQVSARNYLATGGTITTSQPVFDATQTWNAGGVTFTGIRQNITDTASASGSLLIDLQVASTSAFVIQKTGEITSTINSAATSAVQYHTVRANSTGTAANGFGVGLSFNAETTTTNNVVQGTISTAWVDATHASRTGNMDFVVYNSGSGLRFMRAEATATTAKIGFFNTTPVLQPSTTGETVGFTAGGGVAVTDASTFTGNVGATAYRISDVIKHLKNLGLIAQ